MSPQALVRAGKVGVAAGVLGPLTAAVMLAWPVQSPEGILKYPFSTNVFRMFQTWFFVHHLGMLAIVVALALSGAVGNGKVGRIGAWIGIAGTVMLTGMELFAIQYSEASTKAANEGRLGSGYGIASTLIGVGMVVAGIGVVRAGKWGGWRKWIPLVIGIYQFVPLTPAMFSGYVVARLAIGSWIGLFGLLGWTLLIEVRRENDLPVKA